MSDVPARTPEQKMIEALLRENDELWDMVISLRNVAAGNAFRVQQADKLLARRDAARKAAEA